MTYPPNIPTSPSVVTYDRGQQAYFFEAQTGSQTFTGTALPAGSTAYAMPPSVAVEQGLPNASLQVDIVGTATTTVVTLLGSLDGVNYYSLGPINGTGGAGLFFAPKLIAPGAKIRYISAYVSAIGSATNATCSMYA
jgi:hypothetical protein